MAETQNGVRRKGLRTGFTTGSCAAAAAKAAALALFGAAPAAQVEIVLPNRQHARFNVARTAASGAGMLCAVIKDAGDDPDATHGAEICATVFPADAGVILEGGPGVGRVTRPGLGIEPGEPDITSTPRRMITGAVKEVIAAHGRPGARIVISVPGGEEIAAKTLLGRLGVVGGIGILGTTAIVRPYSTAAFRASITQAIDVALAAGVGEVVLTTGGRSEKFAQGLIALPEVGFVQMGDFVGFAMREAGRKGLRKVTIVGMVGKLSKIADGKKMTHAAGSEVNCAMLAEMARTLGAAPEVVAQIAAANTARHVLDLAAAHGLAGLADLVCRRAAENARSFAGDHPPADGVEVILTDFDGRPIGRARA